MLKHLLQLLSMYLEDTTPHKHKGALMIYVTDGMQKLYLWQQFLNSKVETFSDILSLTETKISV